MGGFTPSRSLHWNPSKSHGKLYPFIPPRQTMGFPCPIWGQPRAGHIGDATGFGLSGGGGGEDGGEASPPISPWRTAWRPQPLLPAHLLTCLPRLVGRMVTVGQEDLLPADGALRAGGPVQVGWRHCLGGAGPGLLRGALGHPYLLLLLRLHLDDLPGALSLAGLPLLGSDWVADVLCGGESQGQVSSLQGCWGGGQRHGPGWQGPVALPLCCYCSLCSLPCRSCLSLFMGSPLGRHVHWLSADHCPHWPLPALEWLILTGGLPGGAARKQRGNRGGTD